MKAIKASLLLLALLGVTSYAQQAKRVTLDDGDQEDAELTKVGGSAKANVIIAKSERHALEERFEDEDSWSQRGVVVVSKDATGKIVQVSVENDKQGDADRTKAQLE